jgi:DNA repair protein RadA/Sms
MVRQKTVFVCQECGYKAPKWLGRCPDCGSWNSFAEEVAEARDHKKGNRKSFLDMPQKIDSISMQKEPRYKTGLREFDRVLGGGIVPGSLVLIGGDPGIGKSTLILQVAQSVSRKELKTLYISGEDLKFIY